MLFCSQYKITNMQRCPYIHEMKERLLGEQIPMEQIQPKKIPTPPPFMMDQQQLIQQQPVATIVKVSIRNFPQFSHFIRNEILFLNS